MDEIAKKNVKSILLFITGIIIGLIAGTAVFSLLVDYRIDMHHQKIKQLELSVSDRDTRLAKLEESVNKNKFLVKDVQVVLIYEDELDKISLEKIIKEKYRNLLGKELKTLDAEMVAGMIDMDVVKLKQKDYLLKINKLVIWETVKVWVEVDPL